MDDPHAQRLALVVAQYAGPLVLYARQWCQGAEDVVQETFLKLTSQTEWPTAMAPWLYRVTRNAAISAARSEQRRRRRESEVARPESWFAPQADGLDPALAAEALAGLSLEQREVIVARLWGGLTLEDIAALCGTSVSTVHRRYAAGLAQLRERLEQSCQKNPPH